MVVGPWRDSIRELFPRGRAWIVVPGLQVYVRLTQRYLNGQLWDTLDLATLQADEPGSGALSTWMPEVESFADDMSRIIYVENVINERLRDWLERRGYQLELQTNSWYRLDFPEESA